ncbi:efflux RND transporter periplasmic adaptor subunit [Paracoccaceae bacterium Fryx2]|nr:efflux RND transporter periplasmic adaptor subunit [Paracoccaceae bacterium Fryx2]
MNRLSHACHMLAVTLALAALPALPLSAQEPAPAPVAEPSLPAITVSAVGRQMLRDRVLASGFVAAVEEVFVQPQIEGQAIDALGADVGDVVAQGQVLARLSAATLDLQKTQLLASRAGALAGISQAEAQMIEARSASDEAQRVNQRNATLRAQGSISQAAAETASATATSALARVSVAEQGRVAAQAQLALVEAQIANIDLQLARTEVKSPVAGLVVGRSAMLGAIASAAGAQPMFTLIRDGALEMQADVAEQDLTRVAVGQAVQMRPVDGAAAITGKVRLVEPSVNTATRQGRVRISIDAPDRVRTGMFLSAEILVAEAETLAVPLTAVGSNEGGATVMRVSEGRISRTPVGLGIRDGGMVGIIWGLTAGDRVVTKAAAFVRDGDRINPVEAAPAAPGTN